jgi:16S rRNA U516 pseudouridylate synthase RsuA-like enzyme
MARAGIGSRRYCEDLIREGRVRVSGDIAKLGMKVDLNQDKIFVDGRQITLPNKYTYVLLYKPKGYVTTVKDHSCESTHWPDLMHCFLKEVSSQQGVILQEVRRSNSTQENRSTSKYP